jgi:uroporphyrin-3 C-methyltransferase
MNPVSQPSEPISVPVVPAAPAVPPQVAAAPAPSGAEAAAPALVPGALLRPVLWLLAVVASVALVASGLLWQKVLGMQEQLARQSAESGTQAVEARTLARQAQDLARDTAARQAVMEAKLSEVALQRSQLEELIQSLSRSRDENLVVDIESALRLAQQQAQLTGSAEPLLAALKTAEQRITRASQPRLTPLLRAIGRDTDRIRAASNADTPGLLVKLDELVQLADELPVVNAVGMPAAQSANTKDAPAWWLRVLTVLSQEARNLVRVSRIENPEAALLSPEQSFFLRENLKLKLLNARLGLLARQLDSVRADLATAARALHSYFDPASRKTQQAQSLLQQVQSQMKSAELPRADETLAALTTVAAGR